jgi:hypothetical protein
MVYLSDVHSRCVATQRNIKPGFRAATMTPNVSESVARVENNALKGHGRNYLFYRPDSIIRVILVDPANFSLVKSIDKNRFLHLSCLP